MNDHSKLKAILELFPEGSRFKIYQTDSFKSLAVARTKNSKIKYFNYEALCGGVLIRQEKMFWTEWNYMYDSEQIRKMIIRKIKGDE